eukprot:TRINITY_DN655275_c0_g1_i1.p1 TRINITY_DN655275_c0_g1~~TRINITY_DN655275_c0_g1_i1.p1  ORF type:complete len:699 (-),score=211.85 TRINITY_DN655275_c0_g1_i1:137-2233(-)
MVRKTQRGGRGAKKSRKRKRVEDISRECERCGSLIWLKNPEDTTHICTVCQDNIAEEEGMMDSGSDESEAEDTYSQFCSFMKAVPKDEDFGSALKDTKTGESDDDDELGEESDKEVDIEGVIVDESDEEESVYEGSDLEIVDADQETLPDAFKEKFLGDDQHFEKIEKRKFVRVDPKEAPENMKKIKFATFGKKELPDEFDSLSEINVKERLVETWAKNLAKEGTINGFKPLQEIAFTTMNEYRDLVCGVQTNKNEDDLLSVLALHILNHVMKARDHISKHNTKLKADSDQLFKDQGFTRPRVLILLPFRKHAAILVQRMIELLPDGGKEVVNKTRFFDEYGPIDSSEEESKGKKKPEDWERLFGGNCDDCFRFGINVSRKNLKLFSEFYRSDIIIASPLGIRMRTGAEGEKGRDFDFLSSIEIMVLGHAEVIQMQNLQHLKDILQVMNKHCAKNRDVDYSRVRDVFLDENGAYQRQNLIFSQFLTPELNNIITKQLWNANALKMTWKSYPGSICSVAPEVRQVFERVPCANIADMAESRINFFKSRIFPRLERHIGQATQTGTLIYIPSYFDFVEVRQMFKETDVAFGCISEYTEPPTVQRIQSYFSQGRLDCILTTERHMFYNRTFLRGIKHFVFIGLPVHAHFYSEAINMLEADAQTASCMVLFTKYDATELERIVGTKRYKKMITGSQSTFMLS